MKIVHRCGGYFKRATDCNSCFQSPTASIAFTAVENSAFQKSGVNLNLNNFEYHLLYLDNMFLCKKSHSEKNLKIQFIS